MSKESNYTHGRKRDTCYFCGAFGGVEEHHVIPQRFGGPDKPENIVGLCGTCHDKLERLYDTSFYEFFGIDDEQGKRRFHTTCPMEGCKKLVREKWRNTQMNADIYTCGDHDHVEKYPDLDHFELIATADEEVDRQ